MAYFGAACYEFPISILSPVCIWDPDSDGPPRHDVVLHGLLFHPLRTKQRHFSAVSAPVPMEPRYVLFHSLPAPGRAGIVQARLSL